MPAPMNMPVPNPRIAAINEETKTNLSTKVSMSLHPDTLVPHAATLVDGGGIAETAYSEGRRALQAMHNSAVAMVEATQAMQVSVDVARPGLNKGPPPRPVMQLRVPEQRRAELASALDISFNRGAKRFDDSHLAISDAVNKLTDRIEATLVNPNRERVSVATAAAQVREAVRSLPAVERVSMLNKAIEEGDRDVVHAVLDAPPIISGLSHAQRATLRDLASAAFAPSEYNQREAALSVLEKVSAASAQYMKKYLELSAHCKVADTPRENSLRKLREEA